MRNVHELETVMTHILDHPEEWDQSNWCGTTMCFAGHVAMRNGCKAAVVSQLNEFGATEWRQVELGSQTFIVRDHYVHDPLHKRVSVREYSRDMLGLEDDEADLLFSGSNGIEDLQHIVKGLVNGDTTKFIMGGMDWENWEDQE